MQVYTFFLSILIYTECFIYYRKYVLKITQPSQYRCMQLQYRFAVTSEAPSKYELNIGLKKTMVIIFKNVFLEHLILNKTVTWVPCVQMLLLTPSAWRGRGGGVVNLKDAHKNS